MNKRLIRLTENDLHRIVKESVKKVINEGNTTETYEKLWSAWSNIKEVLNKDPMFSQSQGMMSSSQKAIADILREASESVFKAIEFYERNGYNQPIAHA